MDKSSFQETFGAVSSDRLRLPWQILQAALALRIGVVEPVRVVRRPATRSEPNGDVARFRLRGNQPDPLSPSGPGLKSPSLYGRAFTMRGRHQPYRRFMSNSLDSIETVTWVNVGHTCLYLGARRPVATRLDMFADIARLRFGRAALR